MPILNRSNTLRDMLVLRFLIVLIGKQALAGAGLPAIQAPLLCPIDALSLIAGEPAPTGIRGICRGTALL
ncbi:hypothetical protein PproGo58_44820 [Pseudomonas protegens]|nr:hypothetical protein PproGo58_44820 [Pseudomonas protegens]